jgi:hypothetical protein
MNAHQPKPDSKSPEKRERADDLLSLSAGHSKSFAEFSAQKKRLRM